MSYLFRTLFPVVGLGAGLFAASDLHAQSSTILNEQPWNWSGFYIGAHGGYGWAIDPYRETVTGFYLASGLKDIKQRGPMAGGHAGNNWQYGAWVGGLELDFSATNIKGSTANTFVTSGPFPVTQVSSQKEQLDYLGTIRSRLGFVPSSFLLLYATGGPAWMTLRLNSVYTYSQSGLANGDNTSSPITLLGFAGGAGAEANLASVGLANVLLRVEYLHYDFGSLGASSSFSNFGGITNSLIRQGGRLTADLVRSGLSWKF